MGVDAVWLRQRHTSPRHSWALYIVDSSRRSCSLQCWNEYYVSNPTKKIGEPFTGIMYDYLRLEAPAAAATLEGDPEISEHCIETLVEESSLTI